jgi:hypothetical protein
MSMEGCVLSLIFFHSVCCVCRAVTISVSNCCSSTCATQPNTNKLNVLLVAVTMAIGGEGT